jgi:hypothetical protein
VALFRVPEKLPINPIGKPAFGNISYPGQGESKQATTFPVNWATFASFSSLALPV